MGETSSLLEVLVRRRGIVLGVWSSRHAAGLIFVHCGEVLFVFNVAAKAIAAAVVVDVPVGLGNIFTGVNVRLASILPHVHTHLLV